MSNKKAAKKNRSTHKVGDKVEVVKGKGHRRKLIDHIIHEYAKQSPRAKELDGDQVKNSLEGTFEVLEVSDDGTIRILLTAEKRGSFKVNVCGRFFKKAG